MQSPAGKIWVGFGNKCSLVKFSSSHSALQHDGTLDETAPLCCIQELILETPRPKRIPKLPDDGSLITHAFQHLKAQVLYFSMPHTAHAELTARFEQSSFSNVHKLKNSILSGNADEHWSNEWYYINILYIIETAQPQFPRISGISQGVIFQYARQWVSEWAVS